MKKIFIVFFCICSSATFFASINYLHAADEFKYPELLVSPRASQRIILEAQSEHRFNKSFMIPMQSSAILTLTSGIMQFSNVDKSKDQDETSPWAGVLVGGAWVAINTYYAEMYYPYRRAYAEVKGLSNKSAEEQLVYERMCEESIEEIASFVNKMKWLSAITNFGASIYMASKAESETLSVPMTALSAAAAFAPIIFRSNYEKVARSHEKYKKRIYTPILTSDLLQTPNGGLAPGMRLIVRF